MTSPGSPSSPGLPHQATTGRERAAKAPAALSLVRPKGDAEGVLSALPFTVLTEHDANTPSTPWIVGSLDIKAPYRRTPTARSTCACGRDITARGPAEIRALTEAHAYHRTVCALHNLPERRNAA
ncbi:hypothetical protein [Streptomyces sp. NPDC017964]|uniref:hypothetical protein n=1 Tax=Streptomyces sp. NPDC017964 TaxID=3365022 RepID=UPI0037AD0693